MTLLIVGLLVFLGVHSVAIVAPHWRDAQRARWGDGVWKGAYSVVSLIGFGLVIVGFAAARQAPQVLYTPPAALRHVVLLLMLPVFPLLLAAYLPGRIQRWARHPMLLAVIVWSVAHLLANGAVVDVLLFGGFLAWAVADRVAVARRPVPRTVPGAPPSRANDAIAIVGGLLLYGAFIVGAHRWLFGVSPLG